ncbi:MAG TPA: HAMP domain-containing sensor histidine kinase, partial [Chitinophagales bacterium]|nr:HAMP domain-containing sensor histidine kinase [Chitinophagales bacterium]
RKEPINLRQLLEEIVPPFMVQLEAREGKFHKECPDTPCVVTADRIHLKNVINTLLDNALKYSEGTPEIGIRIHCGEKNIYIQVIDNGIGIPKEYHKRIYEKFFRVPTGDVHNVKGFGLGLSYVKMIAKAAGWKISLQSELNKGSTFSIGIPANTPMNDEQ